MITLGELVNWTRNDWLSLVEAEVGGLKKYGTLSN